jgi:hypothetical protein
MTMRKLTLAVLLAAAMIAPACTTVYEFDEVDVGDESGGRTPQPRSSTQFIGAIFADLLGRTPEVQDFRITQGSTELLAFQLDEQDILVAALDAVGDPTPVRDLIVTGLLHSEEAAIPDKADVDDPADYIADQFRLLLGREPNGYELAAFLDAWDSEPAVGPRTIIRAIVGSREYQSR